MGFIIISMGLYELLSVSACFLYITVYTLLMFCTFCCMIVFVRRKEESNEIVFIDNITSIGIFLNNNTLLSIIFSFIILSLAGLPFFMGFFSKLYILLALISMGYLFLVVILLFVNIIITLYYIRLIRFLFFNEDKDIKNKQIYLSVKHSRSIYTLIMTLFILNILILFFHNYLLLFILNNIIIFFL